MTDTLIPEGFRKLDVADDFVGLIGPLWFKAEGDKLRVGLPLEPRHGNPMGWAHGGLLVTVADMVSEDFAREQPDLLIVDSIAGIPRCQGKEFDYLEYFMQNRVFADAFEGYEHLMDFDRYRIYRRKKK